MGIPEDAAAERARVEALAIQHLGAERAHKLIALGRPAVDLVVGPGDAVGRLGGSPRFGAQHVWPDWDGKPLSFLCELDLAALAPYDTGLPLPETGILSFFYEAEEQMSWGFDPEHRDGWQVVYDAEPGPSRPAPDGAETFAELTLTARPSFSLPGWEEPAAAEAWRGEYPTSEFHEALVGPSWPDGTQHRIGGWPLLQQGPFWEECQFATSGISMGNGWPHRSPETDEVLKGTGDWRLLLQIDTDDDAGWMWGDVGMLYFTARPADVEQGAFERGWMILQCG